jgi:hypothetical protein
MTPAEAEATFEARKTRIQQLENENAALKEGGQLAPLPEDVPPHYRDLQLREGTSNATRAYLKDRRIAEYVLSKGITPEQWEAMPLEQQNQLIVKAPTASGKGTHCPYRAPAAGTELRSTGRYADEGVRNIADTMRWMQKRGEGPAPSPTLAK